MKSKEYQDERIIGQKRKVANEALHIIFYGLILSVLIQQYVFNAPFSQYAAEIILFIAVSIYIVIRNIFLGNSLFDSDQRGQKTILLHSAICGVVVAGINISINYMKFANSFRTNIPNTILIFCITFLSAFTVCFVLFKILYLLNKRKQQQIDNKLNEDEKDS